MEKLFAIVPGILVAVFLVGGCGSESVLTPDAGDDTTSEVDDTQDLNTDQTTDVEPGDGTDVDTEPDVVMECDPGEIRCGIDGIRERCSDLGQWENDPCPEDEACIDEGECMPIICDRGETRCHAEDPQRVEICNETLTGWTLSEICDEESVCEFGVCVDRSCTPGSTICTAEGQVRRCNEFGTGYGDPEDCEEGYICDPDSEACVEIICTPGEPECIDIERRRICNYFGSGYDIEDCVEGTACSGGECLEEICVPMEKRCDPADPLAWQQCNSSGTAWGESTDCGEGQGCSEGICLTQICDPGDTICAPDGKIRTCDDSGTAWGGPEDCPDGEACDEGECSDIICTPGDSTCVDASIVRVCNETGTRYVEEPCGEGYVCEDDTCMLRICIPGLMQCSGTVTIEVCNDTGTGWESAGSCNTAMGERCFEGECQTLCDQAELADSSVGCQFYAVDLDQYSYIGDINGTDDAPYAIVVSNTHDSVAASVTVEDRRGGGGTWRTRATQSILANSLYTFRLSPDQHVEDTGRSAGYGYRVTSTIPVIAYQFNPIDSADQFTNDASLLLPKHTLGDDYYASSYKTLFSGAERSYVTVVGTQDSTSVSVTVSTSTVGGGGIPARSAGQVYSTTINEAEVLQIAANGVDSDMTGTFVSSSAPVAVFGGHECSDIPQHCSWCRDAYNSTPGYPPTPPGVICDFHVYCPAHSSNTCAWCDHLEEQMFPVNTWGTSYVASRVPVMSVSGAVEASLWRVIASENATVVTLSIQPGVVVRFAPGDSMVTTLNAGEFMEFELAGSSTLPGDAYIEATKPVMVVEYIEGQECTNSDPFAGMGGDPAMILMVPTDQYLSDYIFLTPSTYDVNHVVITKPTAGIITLDGGGVGGFVNVGGGFQVSRVTISSGVHSITGTEPFGIIGVGYSPQVSYGYPGGLALRVINPL